MEPTTRKKILFVITKSNWGGAQRYVYDLATSLHRDEFEVEVIVGGNGTLKDKLEGEAIPVTVLSSLERDVNIKKEWASAKELYRLFKEKKPDIVHLNSSKAGGIGAFVARLAGVKNIVFTAHGWAFNEDRSLPSKASIALLHWLTIIFSHTTIAVSEATKEQIAGFPFVRNKMVVVHSGIKPFDLVTAQDARAFLREKDVTGIHLKKKEIIIGMLAELHPIKGILFAIDAISLLKEKHPSVHLYVLGEGGQREILEKHIEKRRLKEHVSLLGFVENGKKYLKAFDVFLMASLSEALAYAVLEAGMAGLPVVATDVGGIPEIIEDAGIIVPSRNARAIAEAIEKILSSKDEKKRYARDLQKRIKDHFSTETMHQNTLAIYRRQKIHS